MPNAAKKVMLGVLLSAPPLAKSLESDRPVLLHSS